MRVDLKRWIKAWAGVTLMSIGSAATASPEMTERKPVHQEKRLKEVRLVTPEAVANSVAIADDDLETVATITTATAFTPKRSSFFDTLLADNMLRAMVSKTTGRTVWQRYQTISYSGSEWRHFTSVNYETAAGPRHAQLTVIRTDVQCPYGSCSYEEVIGFDLTEDLLEAIVTRNAGNPAGIWRFRFNSKNGLSWADDMPVAEIAGALMAVKRYRTQKGLEVD
ncbi:MAG: hypothetical protein AAB263_15285 [Planctomycetota bacterium]